MDPRLDPFDADDTLDEFEGLDAFGRYVSTYTPAAPAPESSSAPAPSDLDEQTAMLKELAGMCMQVARLTFNRVMAVEAAAARAQGLPPVYVSPSVASPAYVAPPAPAEAAPPAPIPGLPADAHLAFHRANRAARASVALWRQLRREQDLDAARAAQAAVEARREAASGRRARVEQAVEGAVHDHFAQLMPKAEQDYDAMEAFTAVCGEVRERLDEEVYGDLASGPLSEIVARICDDAGLAPDWAVLAQEPWARAEIAAGRAGARRVGAPLAAYVDRPAPPPAAAAFAAEASPTRLIVDPVGPPPPPRPRPRAESVRWRRRHEPPGQRPPPPLKVVFV